MSPSVRPTRIAIPDRLNAVLSKDRDLHGAMLRLLERFERWLESNRVVFFREYTDHGPDHVTQVLATASSLISDSSWEVMTPSDVAALTYAVMLHDCAMHLREDGFRELVTRGQTPAAAFRDTDKPWPELWKRFTREAARFTDQKLISLLGDAKKRPTLDNLEQLDMNDRERYVIGEFLRRHHARLAHEIAIHGVPGPDPDNRLKFDVDERLADVAGLIARSHGMPIREAADVLPKLERRTHRSDVHAPFVMAVLRIADYVQVHRERAPKELLQLERLRSPISRGEWELHDSIERLHTDDDDPEALVILARPRSAEMFVKAERLFRSIQQELDESWAIFGEVYGPREPLRKLGLSIRRIKSNLDDKKEFAREVEYVPEHVAFTTAGADLLRLLVGPLYEFDPSVAVRELLQNAVDAVWERRDLDPAFAARTSDEPDVEISIDRDESGQSWLTVRDIGVGMTVDTIRNYFLRAGSSFRTSDFWREHHTTESGESRVLRSGRFGIGALAAFLAGDRILVTTRHYSEPHGVTFEATLAEPFIDLRCMQNAAVGTTVRVRLRDEAAEVLRAKPQEWDWFTLASPRVVRWLDGRKLPNDLLEPSAGSTLHGGRWRIAAESFQDVQWEYLPAQTSRTTCNGIIVSRYAARDPGLYIVLPSISVFDRQGLLPLNLQRSHVLEWPFAEALFESIARDVIGYGIANGSSADPLELVINRHPARPPLCCAPEGWSLSVAAALEASATRTVVIAVGAGPSTLAPIDRTIVNIELTGLPIWFAGDNLVQLITTPESAALTWSDFDVSGAILAGKVISPELIQKRNGKLIERAGAQLATFGETFTPEVAFDAALKEIDAGTINAIAELRLGAVRRGDWDDGGFIRAWLKYLPTGFLPYSESAREALAAHPDLAPHVAYHRELREKRK